MLPLNESGATAILSFLPAMLFTNQTQQGTEDNAEVGFAVSSLPLCAILPPMQTIDRTNYIDCLAAAQCDYHRNYFAMYSSVLDGIATDPALMLVPVDDHLVHRGDGIFEALKCSHPLTSFQ